MTQEAILTDIRLIDIHLFHLNQERKKKTREYLESFAAKAGDKVEIISEGREYLGFVGRVWLNETNEIEYTFYKCVKGRRSPQRLYLYNIESVTSIE